MHKILLYTINPYSPLQKHNWITRSFHSSLIIKKRLNKIERSNFYLDDFLKQVLIGNILGYMRIFSVNANTRIDKVLQIQNIY